MKEAVGQANLTVIAIVLIGVVMGIGMILVPRLTSKITPKACCENARGKWENDKCVAIQPELFSQSEYEKCIEGK